MTSFPTLEEQFTKLQKAKEQLQNSHPKIQKVTSYLRNRKDFSKYYLPKFISLGPIHHGTDENLQLGEHYKLMWAAKYIDNTEFTPQNLHEKIVDNIEELKNLFSENVLSRFEEKQLSWMLFVDGCALLHIMEKAELTKPGELNIKVDQLVLVMVDALLLENHLPYHILKRLWRENEVALVKTMERFLECSHWANKKPRRRQQHDHDKENKKNIDDQRRTFGNEPPTHLLDIQRRIILFDSPYIKTITYKVNYDDKHNERDLENNMQVTYRNIQELKASGIILKSSKTHRPRDISFSHGWLFGKLTLPEIVVDDTIYTTFLNLIAYEICPDFENNHGICSFVAFMDSLIDHPEDVKTLRSAKILINSLGSDEEVAHLFNVISTDLVPDILVYAHVRAEIEKHYRNRFKTGLVLGYYNHFSNPWSIIASLGASFALILTFIQTWYAIHPAK